MEMDIDRIKLIIVTRNDPNNTHAELLNS